MRVTHGDEKLPTITLFWSSSTANNSELNKLNASQTPKDSNGDPILTGELNNFTIDPLDGTTQIPGDTEFEGTSAADVDPDSSITIDGQTYSYYVEFQGVWPVDGKVPIDLQGLDVIKLVLVSDGTGTDPLAGQKIAFTFEELNDPTLSTDILNVSLGSIPLDSPSTEPPFFCFTAGTLISTVKGEVEVENLEVGDKVVLHNGRFAPIRWIGARTLDVTDKLAPIVFSKGAIGNHKELKLSPHHRLMLTGWKSKLLFGEESVFVKAKDFVNGDTVYVSNDAQVTYFHILLDSHEVLIANGVFAESLFLGDETEKMFDAETRQEIEEIFPELAMQTSPAGHKTTKLVCLKSHEASAFLN